MINEYVTTHRRVTSEVINYTVGIDFKCSHDVYNVNVSFLGNFRLEVVDGGTDCVLKIARSLDRETAQEYDITISVRYHDARGKRQGRSHILCQLTLSRQNCQLKQSTLRNIIK